jgi:hypothetical protein
VKPYKLSPANVNRAIRELNAAQDISRRDHHRDGGIWHDFGGLEMCIKIALDALEPGVTHEIPGMFTVPIRPIAVPGENMGTAAYFDDAKAGDIAGAEEMTLSDIAARLRDEYDPIPGEE